jgi:hypothetical protein
MKPDDTLSEAELIAQFEKKFETTPEVVILEQLSSRTVVAYVGPVTEDRKEFLRQRRWLNERSDGTPTD